MKLYKYSYWVYVNYFWICTLSSILLILGTKQYLVSILLPLSYFVLVYASFRKQRMTIFDVLIVCILLSDVISWLLNDYPHQGILILRHIIGPVSYMIIYYIGRNISVEKCYNIFNVSLFPALVVSIIGIYCFFFPPAWYFSIIEDSALYSLDALRLHSIFSSPYQLAYWDTFLLGFIFFQIFQYNQSFSKYKYHIVVFVVTLTFCMMRAPMAGVIIYLLLSLFHSGIVIGKWYRLIYTIGGMVVIGGILFFVIKHTNEEYANLLFEKIAVVTDENGSFVEDRYNLMVADKSLFGDGAGRHNIWADDYNIGTSIRDGEYQKLLQEIGYIGQYLHILLIVCVMLKCMFHYKCLLFEFATMAFLLISMIGANPLSTIDKHCIVFWLVMGRVASYKDRSEKSRIRTIPR